MWIKISFLGLLMSVVIFSFHLQANDHNPPVITLPEAIRLALIHNPAIQAAYENLGISQAEFKQSGLFHNPEFSGSILFPQEEGNSEIEFSIEQAISDFLIVPLQKKSADAALEIAKFQKEDTIFQLIQEIKAAYYSFQTAQKSVEMVNEIYLASELSKALSEKQYNAGNISELSYISEKTLLDYADIEQEKALLEVTLAKEKLSQLIGVDLDQENIRIATEDITLPATEPSLNSLEAMALEKRLDLAILKQSLRAATADLSQKRAAIFEDIKLGLDYKKEVTGETRMGPKLAFPLPLFNMGTQGVKEEAHMRELEHLIAAKEKSIRSEVRIIYKELMACRKIAAIYENRLIDDLTKQVDLTQQHYNAMLQGVYTLLQMKQLEVKARKESLEAIRNYWIKHTELERAIGGELNE